MIPLHIALLTLTIVGTAACLIAGGGRSDRSLRAILVGFLPVLLIGIVCSLLLRLDRPMLEWILPGIAVLLIGVFCKSDTLFLTARRALPIVAVLLCGNFLTLTDHGYTGHPAARRGIERTLQRSSLSSAAKGLREQHTPDAVLPAGPVGNLTVSSPVPEWHTPLTRLYRVEQRPAVVWYPGGKIGEAAEKLQIKPAAG